MWDAAANAGLLAIYTQVKPIGSFGTRGLLLPLTVYDIRDQQQQPPLITEPRYNLDLKMVSSLHMCVSVAARGPEHLFLR